MFVSPLLGNRGPQLALLLPLHLHHEVRVPQASRDAAHGHTAAPFTQTLVARDATVHLARVSTLVHVFLASAARAARLSQKTQTVIARAQTLSSSMAAAGSIDTRIPTRRLERKDDHTELEEQERLLDAGFDATHSPGYYRARVGRNCDAWSLFKMTGEVSDETVATLYALAYLTKLAEYETDCPTGPLVEAPGEWDCGLGFPGEGWSPLDTQDAVAAVAARWRSTQDLTQQHWDYLRTLEWVISRQIEEPWGHKGLQNTLGILVRLWGVEYVWHELRLSEAHLDETEVPDTCREWQLREQKDSEIANQQDRVARVTMAAEISPGETDRYAREHMSVVANNIENIFEFTRTHVQARGLQRRAEHFDETIGAGFVLGALIDRKMNSRLTLPWCGLALFFDLDLQDGDLLDNLQLRRMPCILLHAGVWYVLHKNHFTVRCRDLSHAILLWFDRVRDDHEGVFRHLVQSWDLGLFFRDANFPFARRLR